jgi:uncharacterized protein (TIGR01777 family)
MITTMRVVIGGASGLIGTALGRALEARGDEVIRLVRRAPGSADEALWDPATGDLDPMPLRGADAVVNLSGASVGKLPWTKARRADILDSRLAATRTIVGALTALHASGEPVPALVSASAVGYYGSRPGEELYENAAPGTGFLAQVVRQWEQAALAAPSGTRVVLARTGLVIADGGAVAPLRRLSAIGLGGPIGKGSQHWPWISLRDEVAAFLHLIDTPVSGPVNLAGPTPATASEVGRALAARLHRPYWLPAPAPLLAAALGDAAHDLLLSDQLQVPQALLDSGFAFTDGSITEAIAQL